MVTEDERTILELLARYKHPTTAQVHRFAFSKTSRKTVERRLEGLRRRGLIDTHLLYPEHGARSPRYYHLLLAGARAIGLESVGSNQYRAERREFAAARSIRMELSHLAERQGWRLLSQEDAMRTALLAHLHGLIGTSLDAEAPTYTLAWLLPTKLQPDLLLCTAREVVPVIVAHPHAGRAFWRGRLKRYQHVITQVRAICVPLSALQREELWQILSNTAWTGRYLVLDPADLTEQAGATSLARRLG